MKTSHDSRKRLPATRQSITHKACVGGMEFYITAGKYEDGTLGELFIKAAKQGSTLSGIIDALSIAFSMLLQTECWDSKMLCKKFKDMTFIPNGQTGNEDIPQAKSIVDYIFQWVEMTFHPAGAETNENI